MYAGQQGNIDYTRNSLLEIGPPYGNKGCQFATLTPKKERAVKKKTN
jgi:hypothetical protein